MIGLPPDKEVLLVRSEAGDIPVTRLVAERRRPPEYRCLHRLGRCEDRVRRLARWSTPRTPFGWLAYQPSDGQKIRASNNGLPPRDGTGVSKRN